MALKRTNWGSNKELTKDMLLLEHTHEFLQMGRPEQYSRDTRPPPIFPFFSIKKVNFR